MSGSVRAFVAIELPPVVATYLRGMVARLKEARIAGLRPVRPEGIHLTLKFLGNVPAEQIDSIGASIATAVTDLRPFPLALGAGGVYPGMSRPQVLWVGVEGDLASLGDLHHRVEAALEPLGHPRDGRRFAPHLTVARLGDRTGANDRRRAADTLLSAASPVGTRLTVESVSLMRSRLSSEGARYERLSVASFGGARERSFDKLRTNG